MSRILVTGASGFVGKHTVARLNAAGHDVMTADSKSGDVVLEQTWMKFPPAEVLIHLAGKSFVPDSWVKPASFFEVNLVGTIRALEYCKAHNARLIFLSSYLYGIPQALPISEEAQLAPTNPYALSKKLCEDACQFYAHNSGVEQVILRPFNVYGPGQQSEFLIPSILARVTAGKPIEVKDLEPRRDYVFISDLVEAIASAIDLRDAINVFNVGSGVSYSVAEVIAIIQQLKQTNLAVLSANHRRAGEIMDTVADITRARRLLKWKPAWSLVDGIRETIRSTTADPKSFSTQN